MLKLQHLIPAAAAALALAAPLAQAAPEKMLTEGFDNVGTLAGKGWTQFNQSAPLGTTGWFQGQPAVFTAQAGAGNSYIAANYNNAQAGGSIANWLWTPELDVSAAGTSWLSFFTRTETGSNFADHLIVTLLDTVTNTVSVLADINANEVAGGYPDGWTQFAVNLGMGVTRGKVGFGYMQANSDNANYIGIDSVSYDIPEPESFGLVALALGGLLLSRRKAVVA